MWKTILLFKVTPKLGQQNHLDQNVDRLGYESTIRAT